MAQSKEAATQKLATIGEETKKVGSTSTAVQQSDNMAHALAGAGGGLLSMALTYELHLHKPHPCATSLTDCARYPLITLSTRAQVESRRAETSALDAARRIIKREGLVGLYAGLNSALFGISVTNFVYYYCMQPIFRATQAPFSG